MTKKICENCGNEFETETDNPICDICTEAILQDLAKQYAAQEEHDRQWREFWEQEERDAEERAEHARRLWRAEQEAEEEAQAERNRRHRQDK